MRLTLRTLLAYMDGILEPEQAEVLRKKIEESEFASKLMERIRDVTRRLRLGAPSVGERGALLDPNTVAEYLDNTLHGDRVPDFEKVCLESEMALAEVASCHQILTMILGEPAEIDPVTRQKMYDLVKQTPPGTQSSPRKEDESGVPEAVSGASGEAKGEKAAQTEPVRPSVASGVPEYLREPSKRRRFWLAAALLFLGGFLTMIVLGSLGVVGPKGPLGWLWGPEEEEVSGGPSGEPSPLAPQPPPLSEQPSDKLSQPKGVVAGAKQEVGKTPTEQLPKAPLPEDIQKSSSEPGTETPKPPSEKGQEKPKAEEPKPKESETPKLPEEKPEEKTPSGPAQLPKPAVPQLLGQLVSDREVALRADPLQRDWWRIAPQENVFAGQRILALPTFRPVIGLAPGITLTLIGPTQVELLPGSAEHPPGLKLFFGKIRLNRVGNTPVEFGIQVEGVSWRLTLVDSDATVAMAIRRMHIPGNDPVQVPDPVKVEVYVTRGRASLALPDSPPVELTAPCLLPIEVLWSQAEPLISGKAQPGEFFEAIRAEIPPAWKNALRQVLPLEKVPEWITTDTSSPLEREAAREVEQKLQPDRLARIGLMELLEHRRSEVQVFVSRCLGYLGEFQELAALLNRPEARTSWFESLELLQEAIGWSSESAAAVREAFEKQYGPQNGPLLYRMLLGYSESQFLAGMANQASTLIRLLDHNDLVFRVMSWWNLQKITGKTFYYQPDAPKTKRDPAVKRWREWLSDMLKSGRFSLGKEAAGEKEAGKPSAPAGPAQPPSPQEPPNQPPPESPPETPNVPKPLPEASPSIPAPPIPGLPPVEKSP